MGLAGKKMSVFRSYYTVRVGSVTTGTIYSHLRAHDKDRKSIRHGVRGLLDSGLRAFWTYTGMWQPFRIGSVWQN